MDLILPKYFSDQFLFTGDTKFLIISLMLFIMAFMLCVYALVVINNKFSLRKKATQKKLPAAANVNSLEDGAYQDALKILDRARADSLKILVRAQNKAQGVLDSTYSISQESRRTLDANLQEIYEKQETALAGLSKELLLSYKQVIQEGKEENIRTLYEASEAMKKEAISGVDELKTAIKNETLGAQEALENKIQIEYSKIEGEVEAYKQEKLKNLDRKIFDMLSDIYTRVIRQDLDQTKHEKLILDLLKEEIEKSGLKYGGN